MNKLIILSLLFTVIFAAPTTEDIVERLVYVFKGMAKTEVAECSQVIFNNKDTFVAVLNEALEQFNQGEDVQKILTNALSKVVVIDGFVAKCNLLGVSSVISKFQSESGLTEVVQTILENISSFYSYFSQVLPKMEKKEWNEAAEDVGHLATIATKFQVE